MRYLFLIFMMSIWIAGVVLAHGFWLKILAIIFMPYAWYLVVEMAMKMTGIVT